jgi:hypothetical protein
MKFFIRMLVGLCVMLLVPLIVIFFTVYSVVAYVHLGGRSRVNVSVAENEKSRDF